MATTPLKYETAQMFSKRGLGFLWAKRDELDPGQVSILQTMYNSRKKGSITGYQEIVYKYSKSNAGKLGYGRLYGQKGSLETLEKEIRGTLCKDYYYDLDFVNCHPVLLLQFAKQCYNKELPEVENYVKDRDAYLAHIGSNRDDSKSEIFRIFYGGRNTVPFLEPLAREVREFTRFLVKSGEFADLYDAVKHEDNIYGTYLSYILQTKERICMLALKTILEQRGYKIDVLAYDGVMVRKEENVLITDELLEDIQAQIYDKTGFRLHVVIKPFSSYPIEEYDGDICPKVGKREYMEKKMAFEERYFYYVEKNAIAEIQENKSLNFYTLPHAEVYLNSWDFIHGSFTDRTSFLYLWLKDPARRVVKTITMKPSDDPFAYVQPITFAYTGGAKVEDDKKSAYLDLWNALVSAVSGGDSEKRAYLEKWLAHCLQKPFDLQGTALVVTGDKGVGKDTLFDFFSVHVLGNIYCANYTSTQQFWDKYDTGRMNKLLVKLEEAVGALNRQNDSAFKARITSMHQTFNPKGVGAFTCENFNRYVLTTNESNPVRIEDNDRRFVLMTASRELQGNHAFWKEVREKLFTGEGGRVVGEHLMAMDLKEFNPRILPKDEYKEAIANAEKSSEQLFIESWDGVEVGATELYRIYVQYCAENQLPYCNSAKSFGMRLLVFIRDKKIFKRRENGSTYYNKS
jgi:hypothetical protein